MGQIMSTLTFRFSLIFQAPYMGQIKIEERLGEGYHFQAPYMGQMAQRVLKDCNMYFQAPYMGQIKSARSNMFLLLFQAPYMGQIGRPVGKWDDGFLSSPIHGANLNK